MRTYLQAVLPTIVALATFVADVAIPQTVNIGIVYVAAVALAMRTSRGGILLTVGVCSILATIGTFIPVPGEVSFQINDDALLMNRALALFAICTTGTLALSISSALRASKEDQLTQVYNRRGMEAELAARNAKPTVAILIDIDDFKKINDTWGLLVGDTVLREVAEMLTTVARTTDLICRYGGDEFLILLTECPIPQARKIAERIYRLLSNARIEVNADGAYVRITASLGVSPLEKTASIAEAVRKTQSALKVSKGAGKNCVTYVEATHEGIELTPIIPSPASSHTNGAVQNRQTPPSLS